MTREAPEDDAMLYTLLLSTSSHRRPHGFLLVFTSPTDYAQLHATRTRQVSGARHIVLGVVDVGASVTLAHLRLWGIFAL